MKAYNLLLRSFYHYSRESEYRNRNHAAVQATESMVNRLSLNLKQLLATKRTLNYVRLHSCYYISCTNGKNPLYCLNDCHKYNGGMMAVAYIFC